MMIKRNKHGKLCFKLTGKISFGAGIILRQWFHPLDNKFRQNSHRFLST
uniref:Uncharacterized protein n=1 Tax=Arundo donax TaxID=35708 RepID=A0A0A9GWW5_ARUDO